MRKVGILLLIFLIMGGVSAAEIIDGELCTIEADEVIEDNIFVLCGELRVEGHVEGHIIGAARTATITGDVDGSVYIAGGELQFSGTIGKDIHFAGLVLQINDQARFAHEQGGIISINLSHTIGNATTIPGRIINLGYQLIILGTVKSDVGFWGSALHIENSIDGNVSATVGNAESDGASSQIETLLIPFQFDVDLVDPGLVVTQNGQISGLLDYRGATPGVIEGSVKEAVIYTPSTQALIGTPAQTPSRTVRNYIRDVLQEFSVLGFIGVVFLLFIPRQMQGALRYLAVRPISTLGIGMLTFILSFPIFLMIAFFSFLIVLILSVLPLDDVVIFGGVALVLANIGGASLFYFTAIYIARLIFALALGRFILRLLEQHDGTWRTLFLSMAVGVMALAVLNSIPMIGWGVDALALFMGLGAILSSVRRVAKRFIDTMPLRTATYPAAQPTVPLLPPPTYFPDEADFALPTVRDDPPSPGTQNLPEGFNWWQD